MKILWWTSKLNGVFLQIPLHLPTFEYFNILVVSLGPSCITHAAQKQRSHNEKCSIPFHSHNMHNKRAIRQRKGHDPARAIIRRAVAKFKRASDTIAALLCIYCVCWRGRLVEYMRWRCVHVSLRRASLLNSHVLPASKRESVLIWIRMEAARHVLPIMLIFFQLLEWFKAEENAMHAWDVFVERKISSPEAAAADNARQSGRHPQLGIQWPSILCGEFQWGLIYDCLFDNGLDLYRDAHRMCFWTHTLRGTWHPSTNGVLCEMKSNSVCGNKLQKS